MSNYLGRKSDFTPAVYTRYFERTETRKSPNGHIYFNDNEEELSKNYQVKRDLIFKRLFPSKYADSNNKTENEQINQNGTNNNSLNNTVQPLGDFISLSNNNSSTEKKRQSSPQSDVISSSSDENDDDLLINREQLPTSTHESIIGHIHPRSAIENVRAVLIRELYQRTSDPHTEWLKCKMNISRDYINPKYYADFQRRYRKDINKTINKKTKPISNRNTTDNSYQVLDLTTNDETTTLISITSENEDIIETSPIVLSDNSSTEPEFITLDSDEDEDHTEETKSSYFIDRSSNSFTAISQPTSTSTEDYQKEDSKYAQLPTRSTSSPSIIRPILSKHQRRKKTNSTDSTKPLVSAIDRIIDQMDNSDILINSKKLEQQNLLIKKIKKRKKKKKNKVNPIIN